MLILPPGHAATVRARRRLTIRERWMVRSVAAALVAIVVAVVVSLATSGRTSSNGCIYVTIPAATGAQELSECGVAARSTCGSARTPGAYTRQAAQTIAAECRKAALPVGP